MRAWIGGWGAGLGGHADGIGVLQAGDAESPWASGPLGIAGTAVAASGSPSWLTAHPSLEVIYAALEDAGAVQAYRRTGPTTLTPLGPPVDAGESVCHVAVAPDGLSLYASCWGDGRVVRMTLDAAGRPSAPSLAPSAADPYGEGSTGTAAAPAAPPDLSVAAAALRAAAGPEFAHLVPGYDEEPSQPSPADPPPGAGGRVSRAHGAIILGGGLVATTDLGFDLVRIWRATSGTLRLVQDIVLPRGSGPRHGIWHPSGHLYVVTEHSCELFALAADREGRWRIVSGTPLGAGLQVGDSAAELAASRDAETLYAGVRGSDAIAVLRVRGGGASMIPVAVAEAGTNGPRHHVVVRDCLLVAGQFADEVVSLPLDERTGVPGRVRHRTTAASPTCLLPFR